MKLKTIFRFGIIAIFTAGMLSSCAERKPDAGNTEEKISESVGAADMNFLDEKGALKNQASIVITDFNQKANQIKTDAYKNSKSLDDNVKKMLIKIEEQVISLEERLIEINHQPKDTWPAFRESFIRELETIKNNIQNLSAESAI